MEHSDLKIAVVGIGGIGGSLASYLIRQYGDNVSLLARGKRAQSFREKGLVYHSELDGEMSTGPLTKVAADGADLGVQDIVFVCLKNYSLQAAAEQMRPMISEKTILVPIMNGIEPGDSLRAMYPEAIGIDGLIYCVCTAQEDYSIVQKGGFYTIFVGSKLRDERHVQAAKLCAEVLGKAVAHTRYSDKIEAEIWKKYILNCAYNTSSARFNQDVDLLREDPRKAEDYCTLLQEAYDVAVKAGIPVQDDIVQDYSRRLFQYEPGSTSSLREDVRHHRPTELDAFGGALLRKAASLGMDLPKTREYYEAIKAMTE